MNPSARSRTLVARPSFLALALALPFASHAAPALQTIPLAPGTTSWLVPAGVKAINVVALGGGGGGGLGASGGAGGQVTESNWPVTPGATLQVVIGSAGTGLVLPTEEDTPPESLTFSTFAGGATSLQNGTQWIIAGGGGSGGMNFDGMPDVDLSGGNGCGAPGMGPASSGGLGGVNGQGGDAGASIFTMDNPEVATPGASGPAVSSGGQGASFVVQTPGFNFNYQAGSGGSGWGGGGGGGGLNEDTYIFSGGGGGGSTGGACAPSDNGGAPILIEGGGTGGNPTLLATEVVQAKAANPTDGGAGSLTITYAIPVSASLGGTISGLTAAGLVLESGGYPVQSVSPAANATSFAFADPAAGDYAVTVKTQPAGLQCTVASGTGTISADVTNVAVSCVATPPAGGTTPTPVPSLGALGVLMLSGLLGWLGMRRRS